MQDQRGDPRGMRDERNRHSPCSPCSTLPSSGGAGPCSIAHARSLLQHMLNNPMSHAQEAMLPQEKQTPMLSSPYCMACVLFFQGYCTGQHRDHFSALSQTCGHMCCGPQANHTHRAEQWHFKGGVYHEAGVFVYPPKKQHHTAQTFCH
eukprot:scaffold175822_cov19-Tisochrysis_lutea.AAC.1